MVPSYLPFSYVLLNLFHTSQAKVKKPSAIFKSELHAFFLSKTVGSICHSSVMLRL